MYKSCKEVVSEIVHVEDRKVIKKYTRSESEYDERKDILITTEYYKNGSIKSVYKYQGDGYEITDYDLKGQITGIRKYVFNDGGYSEFDYEGNVYQELSNKDKKTFLKNGIIEEALETEQDKNGNPVSFKSVSDDKVNWYKEYVFEDGKEKEFFYSADGNLIEVIIYSFNKKERITTYEKLDGSGRQLEKREDYFDKNGELEEDRKYDSENNLVLKRKFYNDLETGLRTGIFEEEWEGGELKLQRKTDYIYKY